jgi:hypothetical protein
VDEHEAIRHYHAELCPVSALALLFFAHFHILNCLPPDFVPDFAKDCGEYGHREWYKYYVFYAGSPTKEMSYDSESSPLLGLTHVELTWWTDHHERITLMYKKNNIDITKKTHAGRYYAAHTARAHGASASGMKALGGWNESCSFTSVYNRVFSLDALMGVAMYNARRLEEYVLPRNSLGKQILVMASVLCLTLSL